MCFVLLGTPRCGLTAFQALDRRRWPWPLCPAQHRSRATRLSLGTAAFGPGWLVATRGVLGTVPCLAASLASHPPDASACLVAQSCPTLCDPMDCSPPGSSVHWILQARILEWVAVPSCRGSSQPGIKLASPMSPTVAGRFFTTGHLGSPWMPVATPSCDT